MQGIYSLDTRVSFTYGFLEFVFLKFAIDVVCCKIARTIKRVQPWEKQHVVSYMISIRVIHDFRIKSIYNAWVTVQNSRCSHMPALTEFI